MPENNNDDHDDDDGYLSEDEQAQAAWLRAAMQEDYQITTPEQALRDFKAWACRRRWKRVPARHFHIRLRRHRDLRPGDFQALDAGPTPDYGG